MPHVGEVIRSLRQAKGFSQSELAQGVGISSSLLSLLESGRREPTIKTLRVLAEKLGVPSGVLFAAALADDAHPFSSRITQQLVDAARMQLLEERVIDPFAQESQNTSPAPKHGSGDDTGSTSDG